jgi:hypothetical protein
MKRKAQGAFIPGNRTRVIALCGDQFYDNFVTHTDVEKTYANWAAAEDLRKGTAFKTFPFADIEWVNYRGSDDTQVISAGFTNGSAAITGLPTGLANGNAISAAPASRLAPPSRPTTRAPAPPTCRQLQRADRHLLCEHRQRRLGQHGRRHDLHSVQRGEVLPAAGRPASSSVAWRRRNRSNGNTLGKPEYVQMIFDKDRNEWVRAEMSVYPLHICTRPEVLFTGTMDSVAD